MRLISILIAAAAALAVALASGSAAAQRSSLVMFSSPSHNIGCAVERSYARCDIWRRGWKPPAKPRSCRFDWGQGLYVERRGRAGFVCASDTTIDPRGRVLPYGQSRGVGPFICTSRRSGMTCRNRRSGHGFTLARGGYRAF